MAGTPKQKQKVLLLLRALYEHTDETHALTLQELMRCLEKQGIECERKSIYRDLDAISEAGFHIQRVRSREVRYYWADRPLTEADWLMLSVLLTTGRAVPRKRKPEFIRRVSALAPASARRALFAADRITAVPGDTVTERVYSLVEVLCSAVRAAKRVRFTYRGSLADTASRRFGSVAVTVSPYRVVWHGGYYLVAADARRELALFRVARISDLQETDLPALDIREAGGDLDFDLDQYIYGSFVSSEEPQHMVFRVERSFLPTAERWLPADAEAEPLDKNRYLVTCEAVPEERLLGFLLCHSGEITLLHPASTAARLHKTAAAAARAYGDGNAAESGINYDESGKTVDK